MLDNWKNSKAKGNKEKVKSNLKRLEERETNSTKQANRKQET